MVRLLVIVLILFVIGAISDGAESQSFVISGTVPDKGYQMQGDRIVPQQGSQLKLTVNKTNNTVIVEAP